MKDGIVEAESTKVEVRERKEREEGRQRWERKCFGRCKHPSREKRLTECRCVVWFQVLYTSQTVGKNATYCVINTVQKKKKVCEMMNTILTNLANEQLQTC